MSRRRLIAVFTVTTSLAAAVLLFLPFAQPAAAQYDVTAPVVTGLTFEPKVVDSALADQTITATARITDDLSGVDLVEVRLTPDLAPTGQMRNFIFNDQNRIGGDALDGVYQAAITLPHYSAGGRWSVQFIYAKDKIGNSGYAYPQAACDMYGPTAKCIDPSNETSFVNGEFHLLHLPLVERRNEWE